MGVRLVEQTEDNVFFPRCRIDRLGAIEIFDGLLVFAQMSIDLTARHKRYWVRRAFKRDDFVEVFERSRGLADSYPHKMTIEISM